MLDSLIRPYIDPLLNKAAEKINAYKVPADFITLGGFAAGMVGCFCVANQSYMVAFALLVINRILDGLDGPLARIQGPSDVGAYLDTVCDMVVYASFVFFFIIPFPMERMAGAFVLFSYIGTAVTFLAYAVTAEKHGLSTEVNGKKSFYHSTGYAEGSETMIFMALVCFMPDNFSTLAYLFGTLCWATAIARSLKLWQSMVNMRLQEVIAEERRIENEKKQAIEAARDPDEIIIRKEEIF